MTKADWLDFFEAINGRSATEEEIAAALAAGEDDKSDLPETIGHRFSHCCPQMYRCNASSI